MTISPFSIETFSMADFTDMGIEPKWTGMCAAWAIISPSRSKMAQEESRLSLMFGEKAVLLRVTPISSDMEENRFLKTSNKMGFSCKSFSLRKIRANGNED
jgi:hypothetical protein